MYSLSLVPINEKPSHALFFEHQLKYKPPIEVDVFRVEECGEEWRMEGNFLVVDGHSRSDENFIKALAKYKYSHSLSIKNTRGWLINTQMLTSTDKWKEEYDKGQKFIQDLKFEPKTLFETLKVFPWILWWGQCGTNVSYCTTKKDGIEDNSIVIEVDSRAPFAAIWLTARLAEAAFIINDYNKRLIAAMPNMSNGDKVSEEIHKMLKYFQSMPQTRMLYTKCETGIVEEHVILLLLGLIDNGILDKTP